MSDINPSSMLAVGTILNGKYRIERHLSSGGFGNTYMATNLTFNDVVAVKEFFMRGISQRDGDSSTISVSNPENRDLFSEQLEKFKKEAQRIRQLRSQHIVRVHDLFEANGTAYYVMDYIDGESLAARLKRTNTPLTEAETMKYLGQVLEALETIHDAGLCHMDLKPENIMVDKEDNAILIDFGASKRSDNERFTSTVSGVSYTNGYAPPEQLEQDTAHFGPWTDIYALGATLYKLLTNRKPPMPSAFYSDTTPDKHEVLPYPNNVSQHLRQVILQMMTVRWKDRPQSVATLRTMMAQPMDEQTQMYAGATYVSEDDTQVQGSQPTDNGYDEEYETPSSRKWLYGVIGALLIVLVGVGFWLYSNSQKQKAAERELFVNDSLAQVRKDSIEQVRQDSIARANMVKDFKVIEEKVEKDFVEYPLVLGAMLNGKRVKTDICGFYMGVIDEHDYDGNGINDCLISNDEAGGAYTPHGFYVVYYDEITKEFKSTDDLELGEHEGWGYLDDVQVKYKNDKWLFTFKLGIEEKTYYFDGSKMVLYETKRDKVASVKKKYTHMSVFNTESSDETRLEHFDVNGDGSEETLVISSNTSHAGGWGRKMFIEKIYWNNGKETENVIDGYTIAFLTSKTNGMYDILLDDYFLFKWDGKEYVESK